MLFETPYFMFLISILHLTTLWTAGVLYLLPSATLADGYYLLSSPVLDRGWHIDGL